MLSINETADLTKFIAAYGLWGGGGGYVFLYLYKQSFLDVSEIFRDPGPRAL